MTLHVLPIPEATAPEDHGDSGLGALTTERGNLPLETIAATVAITGLVARTRLAQGFANPHDVPLEATYVFPLPDRAAVTRMRITAAGHTVHAELKERGQAREEYDQAIARGQRASIAEEERPDVFTMRVGNILPGERVTVELTLVGPLSYEDGEATYRLPLVVAPRYIPGAPTGDGPVGDGYAWDTDAVPDASRVTPPVLLPGFPNPVRLSIEVDLDPSGLPLGEVRSSLHAVSREGNHLSIEPGERVNRDFILRLGYGEPDAESHSLALAPDADGPEGTFRLTVLPPASAAPPRPRDVVLVLDRSGSMAGWKMVAARRAAARIVDTLTPADRFTVLTFDNVTEHPPALAAGLVPATDRNRFRAVEHLARVEARGGTEMLKPLTKALALLDDATRDRVVVLVTDGQVGNEDQILARTSRSLAGVRMHTVGIDQAVNAGFLGRLATAGGGRCELVESEDRLDAAMERIHRRVGAPLVTGVSVQPDELEIIDGTVAPARLPDLFPGAPLVVTGRYRGGPRGSAAVTVTGRTRDGREWTIRSAATTAADPALTAVWARAHLRELEDAYVSTGWRGDMSAAEMERRIVDTSLRFGVLCRFTAWLAVDSRVATDGGEVHQVIQPVEPVAGWDMLSAAPPMMYAAAMTPAPLMAAPRAAGGRIGGIARPGRAVAPKVQKDVAPKVQKGVAPKVQKDAAADAMLAPPAPPPVAPAEKSVRGPASDDVLAGVGAVAAEEARRLRDLVAAAEYERREALADLGTRLEALLRQLAADGRDASALAQLRALVEDLAADRPLAVPAAEFERLWERALGVLDDLARSAGTSGRPRGRKEFWKRGK